MIKRSLRAWWRCGLVAALLFAPLGCSDKQSQAEKDEIAYRDSPPPPGGRVPLYTGGGPDPTEDATAIDPERLLDACLKEDQLKQGWVNLFDGQTTWGWFAIGSANWQVTDGTLRVDTGDVSFLCTSFQISDYELLVDFKCPTSTNSGIFLRTTANPQDVSRECYELNIAPPDNPYPTGSLVQRKKVEPDEIGEIAADTWHTYRVIAEGDTIKVWLDDKPIVEYTDPEPLRRGYISLQHNAGEIQFRNILMRPLGLKDLPLDENWESSWTKAEKPGATFNVTANDEGLRLKGGPGQVESKERWDDFVLQGTYQLASPKVNSGIFFRCIPGDLLDGYECQLNHQFDEDHRIIPTDTGAGGIFNRQKARIVVGDGVEPTYVTVLAEADQMTTWINGLQIADIADTRAPDINPRKGARREAGTIALQGHDKTTEVLFSKLSIAAIPQNPTPTP